MPTRIAIQITIGLITVIPLLEHSVVPTGEKPSIHDLLMKKRDRRHCRP